VLYAQGRPMLRDRVASLRNANIYEPQRYRHIISSTLIEEIDKKAVRSTSNFLVIRIMQDGGTLLFASGRYLDRIVLSSEPLYEERVVICDSRRFDTLLAIPL
jgi:3-phenylpropionate/cinnamic acid dioxygenase small subunit